MLPVTVIAPAPKTSRGEEYGATVRDEGIREQTQAGQAVPGPGARAWDARRGDLGGGQDHGPAARLLRAGAGAARDADRRRRDRAQAGGALWHLVVKGEGLRLPAPVADREEAARSSLRTAALPSRRGQKGKAAAYSLEEVRRRESALAEQGEQGYRQLVADWQAKAPATRAGAGAATGERL